MGVDANSGQRPMRRNINDMHAEGGPAWYVFFFFFVPVPVAPASCYHFSRPREELCRMQTEWMKNELGDAKA